MCHKGHFWTTLIISCLKQVVKNHLFSMSTSTVISSVDSLPPSASVEGLPRVPELRDDEQGTRGEQPGTREENDEMGENKGNGITGFVTDAANELKVYGFVSSFSAVFS